MIMKYPRSPIHIMRHARVDPSFVHETDIQLACKLCTQYASSYSTGIVKYVC